MSYLPSGAPQGPIFGPTPVFLVPPKATDYLQALILTVGNRIEISHDKQQQIKRC